MEQFFNLSSTEDVPILDIGDKEDFTGYIDFIKCKDLSHYCMRGFDTHGRPFLTLRVTTYNSKSRKEKDSVGTIFQRYTSGDTITYGTCYEHCPVHYDSLVARNEVTKVANRIKQLLAGESVACFTNFGELSKIHVCYIREVRTQIIDILHEHFYKDLVQIIMNYI